MVIKDLYYTAVPLMYVILAALLSIFDHIQTWRTHSDFTLDQVVRITLVSDECGYVLTLSRRLFAVCNSRKYLARIVNKPGANSQIGDRHTLKNVSWHA